MTPLDKDVMKTPDNSFRSRIIDSIPGYGRLTKYFWRVAAIVVLASCSPDRNAEPSASNEVIINGTPTTAVVTSTSESSDDTTPTAAFATAIFEAAASGTPPPEPPPEAVATPIPMANGESLALNSPGGRFAQALMRDGVISSFDSLQEPIFAAPGSDIFLGFKINPAKYEPQLGGNGGMFLLPMTRSVTEMQSLTVEDWKNWFADTNTKYAIIGNPDGSPDDEPIIPHDAVRVYVNQEDFIRVEAVVNNADGSITVVGEVPVAEEDGVATGNWTEVSTENPLVITNPETVSPLEAGIAELDSKSFDLYPTTVLTLSNGIPYAYTMSAIPFEIGGKSYQIEFHENNSDFKNFLQDMLQYIRNNDVVFAVDTADPNPELLDPITPFSLSDIEEQYGSVEIEHRFVNYTNFPIELFPPKLAPYRAGETDVDGIAPIYIFKSGNKLTVYTIVPDRAITVSSNGPRQRLALRLQFSFTAMFISQSARADMLSQGIESTNLTSYDPANQTETGLYERMYYFPSPPPVLAPGENGDMTYTQDDPFFFTLEVPQ